jgi:O-methyltransferase
MVYSKLYVDNLMLAETVRSLDGDVVECGVWKGGMAAGIAELLGPERKYYLFDSFDGLPDVKEIDGMAAKQWQMDKASPAYHDNCRADIEYAMAAMRKAGVEFECVKGWFENTIPDFEKIENIALLRLDADWYESTTICLENFFPRVVENGMVIIDDYYTWSGCSRAVHDYLSSTKSPSRIYRSNEGVGYIVKTTHD